MSPAEQANQQMVNRLIAGGSLWSHHLIRAFRDTPRHLFLDRVFQFQRRQERWREIITRDAMDEDLEILYADRALITRVSPESSAGPGVPLSSSSQPSLMAEMLEDLRPEPDMSVLEVGAGTGYDAALLGHAVRPGLIISMDVDQEVLAEAWDHLRRVPDRAIELQLGDGRLGWPDRSPYDRIIVTAGTPDLEAAWLNQLAGGGILVAPMVFASGLAFVVRGTMVGAVFEGKLTRPAYFIPLRGLKPEGEGPLEPALPREAEHSLNAPWRGWLSEQGSRGGWSSLSQSLGFLGMLQGHHVHFRAASRNSSEFGVQSGSDVCWYGRKEWHIQGAGGETLGRNLWQAFLEMGGPRPTEFRVHAVIGPERASASPGGYFRQGPSTAQRWYLPANRERPLIF